MTGTIFCVTIFMWCCIPVLSGLSSSFKTFNRTYPNKYKQLIIIILHGPMVILIFGVQWINFHIFRNDIPFKTLRAWLKK